MRNHNKSKKKRLENIIISSGKQCDVGSIPNQVKPKDSKIWYSQLHCLTFSIKRNSTPTIPCVVERWQLDSKITTCPFAVSWPRQLRE